MAPVLSSTELAGMRAAMAATLPDSAVILRPSRVVDEFGGRSGEPTVVASGVPARWERYLSASGRSSGEAVDAARVAPQASYNVVLPFGSDVAEGDTVQVAGLDLHVAAVAGDSWQLCTYLSCVRGAI